ncbi:phage tail assembly protein [Salibacterium halotolerans]|uniref:Phage tail assembly chaperone protein, E, or 41 or 14 n=1 Tax=Salibacterium halotolerans TaxID=1884432 RepID=A0A1I5MNX7_9BACI|nr:phage tail assembly protein [Salibacterium halotolerans]SFP11278.1 Phage tail assembly chaperone protein, E, or 41 or 14 [Salibacterium halotolerans]
MSEEQNQNEYLIEFKKPYQFEGQEYKDVDLSGMENLCAKDLMDADKKFNNSGQTAIMNEMTIGYSCIIASKSTGKPVEFFENLPAPDALKIKRTVMGFLNA